MKIFLEPSITIVEIKHLIDHEVIILSFYY